ncbi:MAG TPA: lipoprotein-releasing system ATP-binding protein LolD [Firmicutes bacterium]|jgi:putative ABC transport system ATP-binding protein|nr:lipoprotein-releasing system ATP-binding protein LolD [Bacillota bacterium]
MAIIKAGNLEKCYRTAAEQVYALRGVDFEINSGDFTIINGPSGSGKTTLLNLLSGIDQPSKGELYLDNLPITKFSDSVRTEIRRDKIGLIFQSFELMPVLTAAENIEYPLLLQKIRRAEREKRVTEILDQVGLSQYARRLPAQLSGGQKQRVAIARALVTRPEVVLSDEPTANLDSETGLKIMELMLELNQKYKVAFVIVTHDLSLNQYAKQIYRIKDGCIISKEENQGVQDRLAEYTA